MKYAIIADIHGNWEALNAVLEDIKKRKCAHIVCLGDLVGYGNKPKECVDIVRGMGMPVVKGNQDEMCLSDEDIGALNPQAAENVRWTRQQLSEADKRWLRELKYVETISGFLIVHATLDAPQRWGYVFDKLAASASFTYQKMPVCFFGHTHVPVAFVRDNVVRGGTYSKFKVEPHKQYFVNVGSVGQPRDGNPNAAYVTYDLDLQVIELHRVPFEKPPGDSGGSPVPAAPWSPKPALPTQAQIKPASDEATE